MDSPLSSSGKERLHNIGKTLTDSNWQIILASPSGRARSTVTLLNQYLHLPVLFDNRLQEQNWGDWEGETLDELYLNNSEELQRQVSSGWNFRAPNGESRHEVLMRAQTALLEATDQNPSKNILVVTHSGVITCLLYHLTDRNFLPTEKKILQKNTLHILTCDTKSFHIDKMNFSLG